MYKYSKDARGLVV